MWQAFPCHDIIMRLKPNHNDTNQLNITTILAMYYLQKHWIILCHYNDVVMSVMVSQITGVSIVYSVVVSGADQRKHQSSASLAFVRAIHRWPVNSPHKRPVTRKMCPLDDVIMVLHQDKLQQLKRDKQSNSIHLYTYASLTDRKSVLLWQRSRWSIRSIVQRYSKVYRI